MKKILNRITNWEAWPFNVLYAPVFPVWVYYILRSGAVWFFTSSNPKLTFGGLEGEPKKEMYDLLPQKLYPETLLIDPNMNFEMVRERILNSGIRYPFIVKPEIGGQGILVRKINDESALRQYHQLVQVLYNIQQWVQYPIEVSVFYIRHPKEKKGKVTGFLQKIPLHVVGDGLHSLEELVFLHPKTSKHFNELQNRHAEHWKRILQKDEKYFLYHAANHNRGAAFIDLSNFIDEDLVKPFDEISHSINDFFYGRYDIMCKSIEGLKRGKDFLILEYNGCGAEPNHFYDTGYTLLGAYRVILSHWRNLYLISRYNRKQGIKPWPLFKGWRFLKSSRALYKVMKEADTRIV